MSEKLEDKTVELLDRSADAIESVGAQLKELAESYGPEVADLALAAARVDAASGLVTGFAGLLVAVALLKPAGWLFRKAHAIRTSGKTSDIGDEFPGYVVGGIIYGIAGLTAMISCLNYLFDAWRWVGLFSPELWLAKTILGL